MRASGLFKRVVALTFAAVFAAGSARADSPRYDVYLLAGQSNMCGRGPLPATAYDLTNVQIWNGNAWEQAVEPFFHDLSTSGAGLAASANPNELTVRGNLASMTGASCELSELVRCEEIAAMTSQHAPSPNLCVPKNGVRGRRLPSFEGVDRAVRIW